MKRNNPDKQVEFSFAVVFLKHLVQKYKDVKFFGLNHPQMLDVIQKFSYVESCNYNNWNNTIIMERLFEKYLKRRIAIAGIEWRKVFQNGYHKRVAL